MSFVLDTNVLSEGMRAKPSARASAWLRTIPPDEQFFSALSVGEIRFGIERMKPGLRRDELQLWLEQDLVAEKHRLILPLTLEVADRWGRMKAIAGRSLSLIDSLIAATALHHGFALATRNIKDFAGLGLKLVDPFA